MQAVAFAQIALALMPMITTGTSELFAFVSKVRSAAQQSNEWTPAAEEDFQRELLRQADSPEAKQDKDLHGD